MVPSRRAVLVRKPGPEYRQGTGGEAGRDSAGAFEAASRAHESLQRNHSCAYAPSGLVMAIFFGEKKRCKATPVAPSFLPVLQWFGSHCCAGVSSIAGYSLLLSDRSRAINLRSCCHAHGGRAGARGDAHQLLYRHCERPPVDVAHAASSYEFASFDTDGPAEIVITAAEPGFWDRGVDIEPWRLGLRAVRRRADDSLQNLRRRKSSPSRGRATFSTMRRCCSCLPAHRRLRRLRVPTSTSFQRAFIARA